MCAPKLRTPGIARSSLLDSVVIRTSSDSEVPGLVTQCIRKSRSLKSGSSSWPSWGTTNNPAIMMSAAPPTAGLGRRTITVSAFSYQPRSTRTTGDSRWPSLPVDKRIRLNAGVTTSAIDIETSTASAYENASGRKNAPVSPVRKKTGSRASASMSEA